jgi:SPP1 family predicted phage head-tail adaptor
MAGAGALRDKVTIQRKSTSRGAAGGEVNSWVDLAEVWAGIMPLSGRELASQRSIYADATHKILIRYRDDVTPKMRVLFGTRQFDIASSLNMDGHRRYLEIIAIERNL